MGELGPHPAKKTARLRILEATVEMIGARSAQFLSLKAVARKAEVSPALIVHYFKSKEELIFAAIIHRMQNVPFSDYIEHNALPSESLTAYFASLFQFELRAGHRTRDLLTMSWWWTRDEEAVFQQTVQALINVITSALVRNGLEPRLQDPEFSAKWRRIFPPIFRDHLRRGFINSNDCNQIAAEFVADMKAVDLL
jgi:AcrR family transcriptional regulator